MHMHCSKTLYFKHCLLLSILNKLHCTHKNDLDNKHQDVFYLIKTAMTTICPTYINFSGEGYPWDFLFNNYTEIACTHIGIPALYCTNQFDSTLSSLFIPLFTCV